MKPASVYYVAWKVPMINYAYVAVNKQRQKMSEIVGKTLNQRIFLKGKNFATKRIGSGCVNWGEMSGA